MLLIIDNYDSFTYNLAQYFKMLGQKVLVYKNDALTLAQISQLKPDYIVISPGPCDPNKAGISLACISHFAGKIPLLGVCLGHQAIGQAFGGKVVRASQVMHGRVSSITHTNSGVFQGLPNPLNVTRYHSLVLEKSTLPACFDITAWVTPKPLASSTAPEKTVTSEHSEIMGLQHKTLAISGVQFHPESILSEAGHALLKNFLEKYA